MELLPSCTKRSISFFFTFFPTYFFTFSLPEVRKLLLFTFLLFLDLKLENYYFFTFLLFLDLKLEYYSVFTFLLFLDLQDCSNYSELAMELRKLFRIYVFTFSQPEVGILFPRFFTFSRPEVRKLLLFTFLLFLDLKLENYYFFTFLLFLDLKLEYYSVFTFLLFLDLQDCSNYSELAMELRKLFRIYVFTFSQPEVGILFPRFFTFSRPEVRKLLLFYVFTFSRPEVRKLLLFYVFTFSRPARLR